ncbi:trichohyalin-like [Acanthopagrus latus]|uniref:trichohyalin-like n=1 Tax=Acanthopagrus latus TaxID=8177 RepID=UPI00187CF119|nr:trichohyalin-like [Acanthopagrus latus]
MSLMDMEEWRTGVEDEKNPELYQEEQELNAQAKNKELARKLKEKINLAAHKRAHRWQMEAIEVPFEPSYLPPAQETTLVATDATRKLEASTPIVRDEQDGAQEPRFIKALAKKQMKANEEKRTAMLASISSHRLQVIQEKKLREKAESQSKAAELRTNVEADELVWEEERLMAQKKREEKIRTVKSNVKLAAQRRAHRQRVEAIEVPFEPSYLPPVYEATRVATNATCTLETSKQIVWDEQDTAKEEQAMMALTEEPRFVKALAKKQMKANEEKRTAMLDSISSHRLQVIREKKLKEKAERQSKADELWANTEADELSWEVERLKAQRKREENIRIVKDNKKLAAQRRAHRQQMEAIEVPFEPLYLQPINETTLAETDATRKLETSTQIVGDEQDAANEEQAMMALAEKPRFVKALAKKQMKANAEKRTAMRAAISSHRLQVIQEKKLKEKAECQSKAEELRANVEADESFWEEERLKAQKKREENIRIVKDNVKLVAQRRAHRQQMEAIDVPFDPSYLPPVFEATQAATDATCTLETSTETAGDEQDTANEEQAMMALMEEPRFVKALAKKQMMANEEKRTAMLASISSHRLEVIREKELKEKAERQSKADECRANVEADDLFWEEERLKAQKIREEKIRIVNDNVKLAAQRRAHRQQMEAIDVPFDPSYLPPVFEATQAATDVTCTLETSTEIVGDEQDTAKEKQAMMALTEEPRFVKALAKKQMMANEEKRTAMLDSISSHRLQVIREKKLKEKAECQSKADERQANMEADELFWEEERLKAQKKREENIRIVKDNVKLAAQRRAHCQQMEAIEVPFDPSYLPPVFEATRPATDATCTLETSTRIVGDEQDTAKEEQAMMALTEEPRFAKALAKKQMMANAEKRTAMLDSISSHRLQVVGEKKLREKVECQSKADERRANMEADELFWEEERLKAQKIREEKIRIVNDNVKLAAQRRAHRQQMEAIDVPFDPSYLPPVFEATQAATDVTCTLETSTEIVGDEQDTAKEKQAMMALTEEPRFVKALAKKQMMANEEKRTAMLDSISSHRLQVVGEKKLREKVECQSKADERRANVEADELFWEEERLKAQKKREEKIRIVNDNVKLAAQRRAHRQQMEDIEVPFDPSYLPPVFEATRPATDATCTLETSTRIVGDEQDTAKEEQAMMALTEEPRFVKALAKKQMMANEEKRTAMLDSISSHRLQVVGEKKLREKVQCQSKADERRANVEADELFWEEERLKAQKKREEKIRIVNDNVKLAAQRRAHRQQMEDIEVPFDPSYLPPVFEATRPATDATCTLETSTRIVGDEQDTAKEEQAMMALTEEPRFVKALAKKQMKANEEKRTAMLDSISSHRLQVIREKKLKEKAERQSKADERRANVEADELFWEEERLKAQKIREEKIRIVNDNAKLAAQRRSHRQQMEAIEVPFDPSYLPPVFEATRPATDATCTLETSTRIVGDEQDNAKEEKAMMALTEEPRFVKALAKKQMKANEEKRTAMLDSISSHRLQVIREKKLKEKAERQSKADERRANVEADELFWEEERLKAQKIREEKIRIVNDNAKLAAQRRAHRQQMEDIDVPFDPSYLPPVYEATQDPATRTIATSTQIVEDEQDAAQEEQAMVALMKGPRLIKHTCQPLPRMAKPQVTKLLQCRKNIEAYQRIEPTQNFCFTEYLKY